jgi:phage-related protein
LKKPIKKYGGYLIAEGRKFDIIAAINQNENSPFMEFFSDLDTKYQELAKKGKKKRNKINLDYTTLDLYFEKFKDHGPWPNKRQINTLGDGFFEFKNVNTGLRVPFYYDELNRNVIILTHYFNKTEQKTPLKELMKMKEIKKQFDEYRKRTGGQL